MPAGGRNWEGFGSDPVLQAVGAAETIRGVQDAGVIATAKHFILNEQEHFRKSYEWGLVNAYSSNIDDRSLHELYLWPFAESVRAGVGSVMCSYQMVNNSYACHNSKLMNGILKDELGFQGFVQSDWLAQRTGVASTLAGLDMTMPGDGMAWMGGDSLWGPHLTLSVLNGSVPMSRLNDMALRTVAAWYQLGQDDATRWPQVADHPEPNFSSWTNDEMGLLYHGSKEGPKVKVNKFINAQGNGKDAHKDLCRQVAAEGIVLLKNEKGALPLDRDGVSRGPLPDFRFKVAIIGEDAGPGRGANACEDRACNQGTLASGWGSGSVEFPYLITPLEELKKAFSTKNVDVSDLVMDDSKLPTGSDLTTLEEQDVCLVFINSDGGEGYLAWKDVKGDRNDLYPQKKGDQLVKTVAKSCGGGKGTTIVIVHSVGAVVVENFIDMEGVNALLFAHLPGQESGTSLVRCPGGKSYCINAYFSLG
jgi:beta-glucosidase-like glycosyl hydrolase